MEEPQHSTKTYPGPISNVEDLCDINPANITGSETGEFEPNTIDRYLKNDMRENF